VSISRLRESTRGFLLDRVGSFRSGREPGSVVPESARALRNCSRDPETRHELPGIRLDLPSIHLFQRGRMVPRLGKAIRSDSAAIVDPPLARSPRSARQSPPPCRFALPPFVRMIESRRGAGRNLNENEP
jgi:hypothetical protein